MALFTSPTQAQDRQDHVVLGAGVASVPDYQGSDDSRVIPVPIIDIQQGRFFANIANGVGIDLVQGPVLDAGVSAVFVPGYRHKDVPEGIDNLKGGGGVRGFARLHAAGFVLNAGVTKVVAGSTKGLIVDAAASYLVAVSPRFMLIPTLSTSWADAKHNDRYFGITPGEAIASGLPYYRPGAGFKDAAATMTANYRLTSRVNLSGSFSMTRSLGDVADSPLVEKKTRPSGFLGVSYRL